PKLHIAHPEVGQDAVFNAVGFWTESSGVPIHLPALCVRVKENRYDTQCHIKLLNSYSAHVEVFRAVRVCAFAPANVDMASPGPERKLCIWRGVLFPAPC